MVFAETGKLHCVAVCCEDVPVMSFIDRLHLFQLLTQSLTDVAACP